MANISPQDKKELQRWSAEMATNIKKGYPNANEKQIENLIYSLFTYIDPANANHKKWKHVFPKKYDATLVTNGDKNTYDSVWHSLTDSQKQTIVRMGLRGAGIMESNNKKIEMTDSMSKEMGKDAFKAGSSGAPYANRNFMNRIQDLPSKDRVKYMKLYISAYTKALIDAPLKEADTPNPKSWSGVKGDITPQMIKQLRGAYSTIDRVDPATSSYKKLIQWLDKLNKNQLTAIVNGDIKFLSKLAMNRLNRMKKTNESQTPQHPRKAWEHLGETELDETAKSEIQQQAAGAALSAKRGEIPVSDLTGASLRMYNDMTEKQLTDFASTKHDPIPHKVEEGAYGATRMQVQKAFDKASGTVRARLNAVEKGLGVKNVQVDAKGQIIKFDLNETCEADTRDFDMKDKRLPGELDSMEDNCPLEEARKRYSHFRFGEEKKGKNNHE